ncbi:MAG: hypothetical protein ACREMY_07730, partial [bacterium]
SNAVSSTKIAANAVTTADLSPDATVPFANRASIVSNPTGPPAECCTRIQQFFFKSGSDTGATPTNVALSTLNGVRIKTGCHDAGFGLKPVATVENDGGVAARGHGVAHDNQSPVTTQPISNSSLSTTPTSILGGFGRGSGEFTIGFTDDQVVSALSPSTIRPPFPERQSVRSAAPSSPRRTSARLARPGVRPSGAGARTLCEGGYSCELGYPSPARVGVRALKLSALDS